MTTMTLWFLGSLAISAAALMRGRNWVAWFLLALIISPPVAALFVLALPRLGAVIMAAEGHSPIFETTGVHGGLAYRVNADETVDSVAANGAMLRFRQMDEFRAFAECRPGSHVG